MKLRLKNNLYLTERYSFDNHQIVRKVLDGGFLFSGNHPTKILPSDLPEWYVFGRYYKRWGYMSTKGIVDMVYVPYRYSNHFLKDDYLLISYGSKIEMKNRFGIGLSERYQGFDENVSGYEIISILRGALEFSNYDISGFVAEMKKKLEWCIEQYSDDASCDTWKRIDLDEKFGEKGFYRPNVDDLDI